MLSTPVNPDAVGHRARKRFGQNFLQDQNIIDMIVRQGNFLPQDQVVEIGPGLGALTSILLKQLHHLTVIELDRDLAEKLPKRVNYPERLQIIQADALSFDYDTLLPLNKNLDAVDQKIRVIGNLPYNISTPLLFHLLEYKNLVKDMHFMLQKEVVDRIVAQPNGKDYGRLSVMMQYACKPEHLFDVPPEAFNPAPKVTSAVFRLTPHQQKPVEAQNETHFAWLVTHLFNQRRKTLRSLLKGYLTEAQLEQLDLSPLARPENLEVADFVRLSDALSNNAPKKEED